MRSVKIADAVRDSGSDVTLPTEVGLGSFVEPSFKAFCVWQDKAGDVSETNALGQASDLIACVARGEDGKPFANSVLEELPTSEGNALVKAASDFLVSVMDLNKKK